MLLIRKTALVPSCRAQAKKGFLSSKLRTLFVRAAEAAPSCGSLRLLRPLVRASHPADRCAKNFSLFQPLAAVEILALDSTHCDALGEVLLENQEDDDDRHSSQCGTCHD